jgi:hypothetical protein
MISNKKISILKVHNILRPSTFFLVVLHLRSFEKFKF